MIPKMTPWIDELVSSRVRAHVAFAGELEFIGATEDDRTGRTVQFRIVRKPEELLVAHPFSKFTRRRRGHAGTRFNAVLTDIAAPANQIEGEIMLLNWNEGPSGATAKFLLDYVADRHPFLGNTRRTKDAPGTGYMAVLMEIDDDDAVVNQERRTQLERAHQKLSNVAAMIVKNPRFHEFLRETAVDQDWSEKSANQYLKDLLNIESKAELDKGSAAAAAFLRLKAAFVDWQETNGYDIKE